MQQDYLYAGIDLHKKYMYVTVTDKMGYVQKQGHFQNTEETLIPFFKEFSLPIQAVVESTYGWYWLADKLEKEQIPFMLAHPKKVNAIVGKKKTDKEDSKVLADLLRTNLLPTAYVPTKTERSLKELLRFRMHLVSQQTQLKNKIRDILAKQNIKTPYVNILCKKGKNWLHNLSVPFPYDREIQSLLKQAGWLEEELQSYNKEVREYAHKNKEAKLLMTIPGVGEIVALILVTEIGDIHRFANSRALASYAGVVPSVHSSGGKTYLGKTGNDGNPYIRWALTESTFHLVKKDQSYKAMYDRIKERKGTGKAKVALIHKLLRAIYVILTKQVPYMQEQSMT